MPTDATRAIPLRWGDAIPIAVDEKLDASFKALTTVVWTVNENPAASGKTCADTWMSTRSEPTRYLIVPPGTIDPTNENAVFGDADAPKPEVRFTKLMPRRKPSDPAIQFVHWSGAPLGPIDVYLSDGTSYLPLAKSATYGSVAPPTPLTMTIETARLVLTTPGSAPCTTTDGAPSESCGAWSPLLGGGIGTFLGMAPTNALVWFGSPGVAMRVVGLAF
jgi:hypothetical protein